jgi:hypothetical protein
MLRYGCLYLLICFILSLVGAVTTSAEASTEVGVWQKMSTYLTKEALIELKDLTDPQNTTSQRERDFCTAVVTLDQQPLSESRLDDVDARLKALVDAGIEDEIDSASRYLLGRIAQLYRADADVPLAVSYFRDLIARPGPGHYADIARVKLAVLLLYAVHTEDAVERIKQAEKLLPGTSDPLAVRDLHRVLARGIMFFNLPPEGALRHLLAADEIGGLVGTLGADQLVQIGELAWDTGDEELANTYYDRLREQYPRDARIFLMDQRNAGNPVPQRGEDINGR